MGFFGEEEVPVAIDDVALCFEGGGMRASYTGAFSKAILEAGLRFPYVCGISAGSSLTYNHVARDWRRSRLQFVESAEDPQFGGVGHWLHGDGYFNSDYLYEGCIEDGSVAFDWATFCANPAEAASQSFGAKSGRSYRWHKEDLPDAVSMADHARASSTLPVMMNPISLAGEPMYDGGLGEGAGLPHVIALADGWERLVLIATRPAGYRKEPTSEFSKRAFSRLFHEWPRVREALITRNERYNEVQDQLEELERQGRALVIRPDAMPVRNSTLKVAELEQAWALGEEQAARELDRIVDFCG